MYIEKDSSNVDSLTYKFVHEDTLIDIVTNNPHDNFIYELVKNFV